MYTYIYICIYFCFRPFAKPFWGYTVMSTGVPALPSPGAGGYRNVFFGSRTPGVKLVRLRQDCAIKLCATLAKAFANKLLRKALYI